MTSYLCDSFYYFPQDAWTLPVCYFVLLQTLHHLYCPLLAVAIEIIITFPQALKNQGLRSLLSLLSQSHAYFQELLLFILGVLCTTYFISIYLSSSPSLYCVSSFCISLTSKVPSQFPHSSILWPVFSPSFWGQIQEKEQITTSILCCLPSSSK